MTTALIDIDTQHDFCEPGGALYVPGADGEPVRRAMATLVSAARERGLAHLATSDDHQLSDPEISDAPDFVRTFPPHCLRTRPGAAKVPETMQEGPLVLAEGAHPADRLRELVATHREILLLKASTDCFSNPHIDAVLSLLEIDEAVVFGVATDICVANAVEGLIARGVRVVLAADACAGLDQERTARLLADWARRGALISTAGQICSRGPLGAAQGR